MAENVKALRRRLRSIRNTMQITRAMEMVSAAKLRRAQDTLISGRPYAAKMQELLGRLARGTETNQGLFELREVNRILLVVITADRGLAGSFNSQVIKRTEEFLRTASVPVELACVGKKGFDYFKNRTSTVRFSITDMGGRVTTESSRSLAEQLSRLFLDREFDRVVLLYNTFVSTLAYQTVVQQLLPLDAEALLGPQARSEGVKLDFILEPSPEAVFASLLPRFVQSKVHISLAEAFTAEHSARMVAMTGATKNCDELTHTVSLRMNKARQSAITKEILEIVGGAEALKG